MRRNFKSFRYLAIIICVFCSVLFINGQDLGSSSDLFRSKAKKETPKKSTPKTTPPKRKSSPPARSQRTSVKSNTPRKTNVKTETSINKIKRIDLDELQQADLDENVIITVGEKTPEETAELYEKAITEGNLARNLRNYTQAENAYNRAKSIKPTDSRAIYGLGNLYSDQQRWEEAEKAYRRAIELEPENPNAHIALSFVLTQPTVGTNSGMRYAEAEKIAQKAIQLTPQNPFGYDQLGVAKELQGILSQETENAYRMAIKLEPTFALAYAHLGRLLRGRGLTKESNEAYQKAIELSEDVPTMILVAEVLQSQQRFNESEQLLRDALKIDAKHPTALFLLGRALITRGNFVEAEEVLTKSVEISPDSFVSYTLLGSVYFRQKNWSKAEETLNKALRVVSPNEKKRLAQEFETVGDAFVKNKKYADAARIYKRAVSLNDEKVSLKVKLAEAENNNNSKMIFENE
jgi:tetratricopeptide (TPR) repeat protein